MKHLSLLTLSLNPALDVTLELPALAFGEENPVAAESCQAAGKGANVARCFAARGIPAAAVVLLGRENAGRYLPRLLADGVPCHPVFIDGWLRENLTLRLPGQPPTRLMRKGSPVGPEDIARLWETLAPLLTGETLIVVGGKLPPGLSAGDFLALCHKIHGTGASLVLDTSSLTGPETVAIAPALIKPNRQELSRLVERPLPTREDALAAALSLHRAGAGRVLASLGGEGLLYAGPEGSYSVTVPPVPVEDTVGAGDSLLAEFLIRRRVEGLPLPESLRWAAAAGTASCQRPGTHPPKFQDMEVIHPQTAITTI